VEDYSAVSCSSQFKMNDRNGDGTGESSESAFIEIFSTTDGRSQSMQSDSKPWTRLRSAFGELGDEWSMFV